MKNHLVLLVDDNPEVREILRRLLEDHGFDTAEAENEEEAWRFFDDGASGIIQAVVADVDLSESGGGEQGGWVLAARLAKAGFELPISLSSFNARLLAGPNSPSASGDVARIRAASIVFTIDRNVHNFEEQLLSRLRSTLSNSRHEPIS